MATPDWTTATDSSEYKNDIDAAIADHESRLGNQASTALGGTGAENGANTWAKLADFTLDGPSQAGRFEGVIMGGLGASEQIIFSVLLDATGGNYTFGEIILHSNIRPNVVANSGFKLVASSTTAGTSVGLWIKKELINLSFYLKEISKYNFSSVTYFTDSAWQSADPGSGAAFEVVSAASDFNAGAGVGQTWQNVVGSRSAAATYTNTTNKPIVVMVTAISSATGTAVLLSLTIDGVASALQSQTAAITGINGVAGLSTVIPVNGTYRLDVTGGSIHRWWELR